jgi:hypothetical protein
MAGARDFAVFQLKMICYAVKDWEKHFENSESRKIKSLTWVPVKNKHDGKGYRRLVQQPNSVRVFCAFVLIVEVASKMPTRGLLLDEDGPLTASDLSVKTGFPESIFEEAFKTLTDSKIGWLIAKEVSGSVPERPDASGDAGICPGGTEGNGSAGNRTEVSGESATRARAEGAKRLHGIPAAVEEVIELGAKMRPRKDEKTCRAFWAHYEGQARTNENGDVFWITSGEAVVTNWRVKLSTFGEDNEKHRPINGNSNERNRGYNADTVTTADDIEKKFR